MPVAAATSFQPIDVRDVAAEHAATTGHTNARPTPMTR
jgi:hypothetical protein